MRSRLTILILAVTSLVVIAYTVPLAIIVRTQADERARVDGERIVEDAARSVVPLASRGAPLTAAGVAEVGGLPPGVGILDANGDVAGSPDFDVTLAESAAADRTPKSRYLEDGSWQVSLPVIGADGWVVASKRVPVEDLSRGVTRAWLFLGLLGVMLVAAALVLADRLGRSLRGPVTQLAEAAGRIGSGELDLKVARPPIAELSIVADALNRLAPRLRHLLTSEREALADLSHRLRTPLAALQLQAESLSNATERNEIMGLIDRMQMSVDRLIVDARAVDLRAACDLGVVAGRHAEFWSVLADEELREMTISIVDSPMPVAISAEDLGDALDIVIGNVFTHTDRGTDLSVRVDRVGAEFVAAVDDAGPGFPTAADPLRRGVSGAGSTGLGLDIARRVAERAGGSITLSRSTLGGALVELRFPAVDSVAGY